MGKWMKILAGILVVLVVLFFTVVPWIADKSMNARVGDAPYPVGERAAALHKTLRIADLHADSMLWKRDFLEEHDYGLVDLPRAQAGNVALQVFGVVTKVPPWTEEGATADMRDQVTPLIISNGWPVRTWGSLLERTLYQAERLSGFASASNGDMVFVTTRGELAAVMDRRSIGETPMAALLGIEGAQALDGDVANIEALDKAGVRMIGFAHFYDNFASGSAHGREKHGLTDAGRTLLAEVEAREMVVDVAHISPKALDEVLNLATRPVVVSHGGVKGTCPGERNISDDQIRKIAAGGGIIGIGIWKTAVCSDDLSGTINAIKYVRDLVGAQHVALGMDMDGSIHGYIDVSETAAITQGLMDAGLTDDEIRLVMGENTINFLLKWLPGK